MLKRLGWLDGDTEITITGTGKNVMMKLTYEISSEEDKNPCDFGPSEKLGPDMSNQRNASMSSISSGESGHNPHIMIVDDEPDVLVTYESFLSYAGYDVNAFADSYQALKAFASEPRLYDLIILDIRMENLNGLQLYQCMKAMNQYSKIIFISALDATQELTTMIPGISSQEILKKPVDKENFLKSIRLALA
jgi:CheY-like chemotaxis protein